MYSCNDTRCRVGCPIRISTDQRLLAAPRGFSQRATSFIASWCQGIHRMPFLYSISCDVAPKEPRPPCTETILRLSCQGSVVSCQKTTATETTDCLRTVLEISTPHTTGFSRIAPPLVACASHREKFDKIVHNASEPSPPTVGALSSQTAIPGQTIRPNDAPVLRGQLSGIRTGSTGQTHAPTPADDAPRDAPEPDSHFQRTTRPPNRGRSNGMTTRPRTLCPGHMIKPNSGHSAILIDDQWSVISGQENKSLTDR